MMGVETVTDEPPAVDALRTHVLAGRHFGPASQETAARLAAFLHGGASDAEAIVEWFGPALPSLGTLRAMLDRDIAVLDRLIAEQLDAVLHAPRLQMLEGRWRGLRWLLAGIEPGRRIKVRLLAVTWTEICRDLERALEFDQSNLFQRVYEDEFGMPGGEPFGLIVIDHAVRPRRSAEAPADDVGALLQLASIAAAAFTPMVLAAHPSLLEVDDFARLGSVQDIAGPFRQSGHARWNTLTGRSDTRFLGVALPRLLARLPWGDDPGRRDGFRYRSMRPMPRPGSG